MAIDPDSPIHFNMGLVNDRRGDLAAAEEWYRKAVAAAPTRTYYRDVLDNVVQRRARQDEVVAGRANPANSTEAIEFAERAYRPPRRRYVAAARLYSWAFVADSALADDLEKGHRYNAACIALRAAAGQDEEMTAFGVEEWGHLNGLALKWLRTSLAQWASRAKDPKQRQKVRDKLTHWKNDPDLAPIRDPASLAAMPSADRKAWESLWGDVDALLASINQRTEPSPTKP